jgi:hypothetical protein
VSVHTLFHRVKGDWTLRAGRLTSTFTPFAGYDLGAFEFGSTTLRADIYALGAREDLTLEISRHLLARAGIDVKFEHVTGTAQVPVIAGAQYVPFPGAEPQTQWQQLERVIHAFDGALYGELDVKLGPLTITPGTRLSASRLYGQPRSTAEPRLWIRFAPSADLTVKASAGLYTQPPDVTELEPPPFGVPSLVHEKAFQASLGVERRLSEVVSVDLTGYYNRRYDLVVSPGSIVTNPDGTITRNPYANEGLGRAWGLELLLRHEVTRHFFGWLAYTLNRSEARRAGEDRYVVTAFDQTHILTAVGSYRLPGGFEIGARFRYVTGQPTTPLQHRYDVYNADSNRFAPTRGAPYAARERAFHQLDVRVDKSFLFESWTLGAYLDVQNVYNRANPEGIQYNFNFRESKPQQGLPLLTILGIRAEF